MAAKTALLVSLAALPCAQAWGVLGHATVAYVAQNYLNADTASWAKGVLGDTSTSYLANIASWADDYRSTTAGKFSAPFHFIDAEDNPPSSCNVDYTRDCGASGCSISAIANYTQRVADGRLSAANTAEALKFLVHFLGDITQPLHDEAYEVGGNDIEVTFQGYSDNLHADWDTYMPQVKAGSSTLPHALAWANNLTARIDSGDYKSQAASWISGDSTTNVVTTATKWAADANAFVCSVVMPNGAAALQTGDLYPTYYESAIPTIELQLAKGGYRLANWLDMIYTSSIAKRSLLTREELKSNLGEMDWMPVALPLSPAKLAREAAGYDCGHKH